MIIKGEQYDVGIKIKYNGDYITPSDVDDVRIQIDTVLKTYSNNELTFDSENNMWLYPMTQTESLLYKNELASVQVGIKQGTTILYSQESLISVMDNIIERVW